MSRKLRFKTGSKALVLGLTAAFILSACGSDDSSSSSSTTTADSAAGDGNKGPFETGAAVSCTKLDSEGTLGTVTTGSMTASGKWSCPSLSSGTYLVQINGTYENSAVAAGGTDSSSTGTIAAVIQVSGATSSKQVTTMTTIAADAIRDQMTSTGDVASLISTISSQVVWQVLGVPLTTGQTIDDVKIDGGDYQAFLVQFDDQLDREAVAGGNDSSNSLAAFATSMVSGTIPTDDLDSLNTRFAKREPSTILANMAGVTNNSSLIADKTTFTTSGTVLSPTISAASGMTETGDTVAVSVLQFGATRGDTVSLSASSTHGTVTFAHLGTSSGSVSALDGVAFAAGPVAVTVSGALTETAGYVLVSYAVDSSNVTSDTIVLTATSDAGLTGTLNIAYAPSATNSMPYARIVRMSATSSATVTGRATETSGTQVYAEADLADYSGDADGSTGLTYYFSNSLTKTGTDQAAAFSPSVTNKQFNTGVYSVTLNSGDEYSPTTDNYNGMTYTGGKATVANQAISITGGLAQMNAVSGSISGVGGMTFTSAPVYYGIMDQASKSTSTAITNAPLTVNDLVLGTERFVSGFVGSISLTGTTLRFSAAPSFSGTVSFGYAVVDDKSYGAVNKVQVEIHGSEAGGCASSDGLACWNLNNTAQTGWLLKP